MALSAGQPVAVVLQYAGYSPQPIFVMGENAGIEAILANVIKPRTAYVAARPEHLSAIAANYRVEPGPAMLRMWVDTAHFRPFPADVERLLPVEIGELNRLYQLGFASWLPASAISDGLYYGIRVGGRLVSAAGTHVISPSARLAVVGNVMTHADFRGRGYATAVTGAVTAELLRFCDQVVLERSGGQSAGAGRLPAARLPGLRDLRRAADPPHRGPGAAGVERSAAFSPARSPEPHGHPQPAGRLHLGARRYQLEPARPRRRRPRASPPKASARSNGPSARCRSCG